MKRGYGSTYADDEPGLPCIVFPNHCVGVAEPGSWRMQKKYESGGVFCGIYALNGYVSAQKVSVHSIINPHKFRFEEIMHRTTHSPGSEVF